MNDKTALTAVHLNDVGKKFGSRWVLRHLSLELTPGSRIALEGPNGSGKSTLLQMIAGYVTPSAGSIRYTGPAGTINRDSVFRNLSFAAPYMEVIEDFNLLENIRFYMDNKPLLSGCDADVLMRESGLADAKEKQIKHFSSGMKQRLKLALAFLADTDLLLLDEPLTNLDEEGYGWYKNLASRFLNNRIVVVGSNQVSEEAFFCTSRVRVDSTSL
ncbi:MAG TPA: ATP-binding cassette domain-containing protein [Bacteroidia bacterium]|nr:ATP-binding cassette domain-containing protein [Bacteroidia bacterium]